MRGFIFMLIIMVEGEEKCPYSRLGPKLKDKEYALIGQNICLPGSARW